MIGNMTTSGFRSLVKMTDGLSLRQVTTITSIESSTIQNWIKRGYVAHPVKKKYYERHISRIMLINELKENMYIDDIGKLLNILNGDVESSGDDIVEEFDLLEYYEEIKKNIDHNDNNVKTLVKKVLKNSANDKLVKALEIMAYAYLAQKYQKLVDENFMLMTKEN